ncbi:MAG: hypothetical protein HC897_15345, partial [Thermoanaerobaculia bacterium]|nr:hypothetical protein [Thermoanaerobaculia bacterium]
MSTASRAAENPSSSFGPAGGWLAIGLAFGVGLMSWLTARGFESAR